MSASSMESFGGFAFRETKGTRCNLASKGSPSARHSESKQSLIFDVQRPLIAMGRYGFVLDILSTRLSRRVSGLGVVD